MLKGRSRGRCFCPSCQAKQVAAFLEQVLEEVLEEVDHRQLVWTIPRVLRPAFCRDRNLLGEWALASGGATRTDARSTPESRQPHGDETGVCGYWLEPDLLSVQKNSHCLEQCSTIVKVPSPCPGTSDSVHDRQQETR